jgi:hypothetical protein
MRAKHTNRRFRGVFRGCQDFFDSQIVQNTDLDPGSGIRAFLTPGSGIRGWVKNQDPDPGYGMNNSDDNSES